VKAEFRANGMKIGARFISRNCRIRQNWYLKKSIFVCRKALTVLWSVIEIAHSWNSASRFFRPILALYKWLARSVLGRVITRGASRVRVQKFCLIRRAFLQKVAAERRTLLYICCIQQKWIFYRSRTDSLQALLNIGSRMIAGNKKCGFIPSSRITWILLCSEFRFNWITSNDVDYTYLNRSTSYVWLEFKNAHLYLVLVTASKRHTKTDTKHDKSIRNNIVARITHFHMFIHFT
jgi:hypothetical protein